MLLRFFTPRGALAAAAAALCLSSAQADVFYVTDANADVVTRINAAGVKSSFPNSPSGLTDPQQVVFDSAGNAYVADSGLGKVLKFPGGEQVGSDVPGATALAFSPSGVLHVASATDDTIRFLNGDTFSVLDTLPANATIRSIAFDTNGDVYAADSQGSRIFKVTPDGAQSTYSSAVTSPFAVAFDRAGKLHVTDAENGGRVASFTGNGNNTRPVIGNLGAVRGLAFDQANDAYYLTATGELRRVSGSQTELLADNLGAVQLLTARAPAMRTIAHRGMTVPAADDAAIATVGSPAIGAGQVAFKSMLATAPNVTAANALALFRSDAGGALELLARKAFPAPGMDGGSGTAIMLSFADPVMNNSGRVAFAGMLRPGFGNVTAADSLAIFSDYDGGALRPVLRKGQASLGNGFDPAVKFTGFRQLVLPDDAGPAVLATVAGPGVTPATALGLWSLDLAGNLSLIVRSGDMVMAGGKLRKLGALKLFNGTPMSLGQARHFGDGQAFTMAANFTDGFAAILRVQAGSGPEVLLEKGAEAGAAIPNAKVAVFGNPAMSADGATAFRAVLAPLPGVVTAATAQVIFSRETENLVIARSGDPAPGVSGGFFATLADPVASPSGGVAFFGRLKPGLGNVTATTAAGLWQDLGEGVELAARQADAPSGVPGAARFAAFKQYVLPSTGGVVFIAVIAGDGITASNNLGLWANDGAGATELLLRKGDKLSIAGKMRTVTAFKLFTATLGSTGQSRQFDEGGAVTCQVVCSDGTQAILAIQRP